MPDVSNARDTSLPEPRPSSTAQADSDRQRADRLAALLLEREDLLAIVGHELRNPLHALGLQLRLARACATSTDAGARIEKAEGMLDRYVNRVTVLFELIRSPADGVPVHPVETDLAALLRRIADGLAAEAQFRDVELRVETLDAACMARVDPQFIEQMVDNLLINAFKHAAARRVTLSLQMQGGADAPQACIEVADDGRGVAAADHERIFGKLVVGQNSQRGTGTGLGLWIVRRLATALGGTVTLHDRPAGGSVFTLVVPLRGAAPDAGSPSVHPPSVHPPAVRSSTDP